MERDGIGNWNPKIQAGDGGLKKAGLGSSELFFAGSVAGLLGKTSTAPLDRVRILYQVNPDRAFSLSSAFKTARTIYQNTGLLGLWRGNATVAVRSVPYAGIQFSTFPSYEDFFRENVFPVRHTYAKFAAGAAAGTTATVMTYPFDLIRARLAAHWSVDPRYPGVLHAVREICKTEGPLALTRGLTPTVLGIVPYSGLSFGIFEAGKAKYLEMHTEPGERPGRGATTTVGDDYTSPSSRNTSRSQEERDIPLPVRLFLGGLGGLVGQYVSYPFHVVRRRMQVQESETYAERVFERTFSTSEQQVQKNTLRKARKAMYEWPSFVRIFFDIYMAEGLRQGLFKGSSVTLIKGPIATAVTFASNDMLKQFLQNRSDGARCEQQSRAPRPRPEAGKRLNEHTSAPDPERVNFLARTRSGSESFRPPLPSQGHLLDSDKGPRVKLVPEQRPRSELCSASASGPWSSAPSPSTGTRASTADTSGSCLPGPVASLGGTAPSSPALHGSASGSAAPSTNTLTPLQRLACGSMAGAIAKTVIAPGDRVKILYQTNPARVFTWLAAMKTATKIYRNDGALGFWRGHGATLLRVCPYAGISFTCYPEMERLVNYYISSPSSSSSASKKSYDGEATNSANVVTSRFLAGSLAGMLATGLTYPLDLMRAKMAAHWAPTPLYHSYREGFQTLYKQEGFFSLFKGLRPTLLGIMPYAGLSFGIYENLKTVILDQYNQQQEKEGAGPAAAEADFGYVTLRLAAGAAAGLIAQSVTYPLDITRRRMQVMPAGTYRNELDAIWQISQREGVRKGLFKGLSMNYIKGPISVAISFNVNDTLKNWISSHRSIANSSSVELPPGGEHDAENRERVRGRALIAPCSSWPLLWAVSPQNNSIASLVRQTVTERATQRRQEAETRESEPPELHLLHDHDDVEAS